MYFIANANKRLRLHCCEIFITNMEVMMTIQCSYPKAVHVRWYRRYRFNRWERVCEHCRSYPNQQLSFDF